MVRRFSLVSAVAGLVTGGALLVAQAQQVETPAADANQQQTDQSNQQEANQEQEQTEAQNQANQEQNREQEARTQEERQARQQRRAAQDRGIDASNVPGAADRGDVPTEADRLRRGDVDRGPAVRQDRGQIEGRQQGRFQQDLRDRGDLRTQQRGQAQFEGNFRGQQQPRDLGLEFETTDQGQLTVSSIEQGTVAADVGLQEGDRIVAVDGRTFQSGAELREFLMTQRGERIPIVVERNGERQTVFWTAPQQFAGPPQGAPFGPDPFQGRRGMVEQRFHRGFAEGQFARPALGVHLDPHAQGVVVRSVVPHSPACDAGIQPGDRIISMNGQQFRHYGEFVQAVGQMPPNQPVTLHVARNGQPQVVQLQPEPWQVVFQDRGMQQQFAGPPQQFGPGPQWGPGEQFGARGPMQSEQRGRFDTGQPPRGQPYGAARPPLNGQAQGVDQEIDQLHREIDNLRQQVQDLRQQVESLQSGARGQGAAVQGEQPPALPSPPQGETAQPQGDIQ